MSTASRISPCLRAAATAAIAAALALTIAAPAAEAEWSMFRGNPAHTGYADTDAPNDSLLAWVYAQPESIVYSSPAIGPDGTIYVGTVGEGLLALWPDGMLRWRFDAGGNFRHSSPAVGADGTIYVGGGDGRLYAVRPNGTPRWTFTAAQPIKTSPNLGADGTVYFGADDGKLYAVGADGSPRWTFPTGDTIRSSPAVAADGTILFGSEDAYLYAVTPSGALRWRALTGDQIRGSSPAVSATGVVCVGSYDGFLYGFDLATGAFRWAFYTGSKVRSSPAFHPDGTAYVCAGKKLFAVDAGGQPRWEYDAHADISGSSPAYAGDDDVLCFGTEAGVFHAVHADGSGDWTYTVGSPIFSSPALSPWGHVYVGDSAGRVWAFGQRNLVAADLPAGAGATSLRAVPNPALGPVRFLAAGEDAAPGSGLPPQARMLVFRVDGTLAAVLGRSPAGSFLWDPRASGAAAGLYFFRLEGGHETGRLVVLR